MLILHTVNQQNLVRPLFSDGNHDKPEEKINTPEMNSVTETEVKRGKFEGLCCSCSKKSLCKTNKCRCRSTGGSCGTSCGCTRFKCTNRELNPDAADEPPKSENAEHVKNASAVDIAEDGIIIASEGAKLLQSALVGKPADVRDNLRRKKMPLHDIQNSLVVFFPLSLDYHSQISLCSNLVSCSYLIFSVRKFSSLY